MSDYIPRPGSLPGQVCQYFADHPVRDHSLTRDEIAERWDTAKQSVHTQLNATVGADLLTRFSDGAGTMLYRGGPNLRAKIKPQPQVEAKPKCKTCEGRGYMFADDKKVLRGLPCADCSTVSALMSALTKPLKPEPPRAAPAPRPPAPATTAQTVQSQSRPGWPLWPDAMPPNAAPASPAAAPAPRANALTRALASTEPERWDAATLTLDTDVPLPEKRAAEFDWLVFLRRFKVTNSRKLENRYRRTCAKYATQLKNDAADPRKFVLAADGDEHFRIWRKA